jgi:hypothetical protein
MPQYLSHISEIRGIVFGGIEHTYQQLKYIDPATMEYGNSGRTALAAKAAHE